MVPGVSTTSRTRPLMISALEMYMREGTPKIRSKRLIQEMFVFKWQNGKAQAEIGYNDDLVIAACIGCWVRDTALTANKREADYKMALLNNISVSTTSLNTKIEGQHGFRGQKTTFTGNDGRVHNLDWIIKG